MRKSLLVFLAVLIALPAANAIAQPGPTLNVAIIKCIETNAQGGSITVHKTNTTFDAALAAAGVCTLTSSCAACLRDLAHDFQCRGGSTFTSNTETVQQSTTFTPPAAPNGTTSINKFVFACGPAAP
jgi:hypothetical protein